MPREHPRNLTGYITAMMDTELETLKNMTDETIEKAGAKYGISFECADYYRNVELARRCAEGIT